MEKDIDYTERIRDFMALIENENEEIAFKYLSKANWDETKAANLYNEECRPKYSHFDYSKDLETEIKENLIIPSSLAHQNQTSVEEASQGFFAKYFISPIVSFVTGMCSERREVKENEEDLLFRPLPERIKSFSSWSSQIKQKLGVMILYTGKDVGDIRNLITEIISNDNTYQAMKHNCVVFSVLVSCNEGTRIASLISDELMTPCILFSFNTSNNSTFNRSSVIHTLEGVITYELFSQALFTSIEKKMNLIENPPMTNAQIIEQQKRDLKELEKQEQVRRIEEENLLIEEKRRNEEMAKKQKEKELKIEQMRKKIAAEPPKGDNTTLIIFRYPDGNRRIERRFFKHDSIQLLYDFIESLGDDIYTEPESEGFELMQSIPFKKFSQMDKTLEEENLCPNAVIQIKEL